MGKCRSCSAFMGGGNRLCDHAASGRLMQRACPCQTAKIGLAVVRAVDAASITAIHQCLQWEQSRRTGRGARAGGRSPRWLAFELQRPCPIGHGEQPRRRKAQKPPFPALAACKARIAPCLHHACGLLATCLPLEHLPEIQQHHPGGRHRSGGGEFAASALPASCRCCRRRCCWGDLRAAAAAVDCCAGLHRAAHDARAAAAMRRLTQAKGSVPVALVHAPPLRSPANRRPNRRGKSNGVGVEGGGPTVVVGSFNSPGSRAGPFAADPASQPGRQPPASHPAKPPSSLILTVQLGSSHIGCWGIL